MAYNPQGHPEIGMGMPAPVSSDYCVPNIAQFEIDYGRHGWQKVFHTDHRFSIKDAQGSLLFDVKSKSPLALHTRRVLRDASGNVLVLVKNTIATMHKKWSAYRGEDDNNSNLLFTLSKSAYCQRTPSFNIFLASNQTSRPDFVLTGDYKKYNYDVLFYGTVVAKASRVTSGRDQPYGVTVNPGVDHAFIASLVTIMDQMKHGESKKKVKITFGGHGDGGGGGGDGGGGGGCGGGCGGG